MGDAQTIQGSCKNGHVRTEQNTTFHKDTNRGRYRIRCLDCKRAGSPDYTGKGRNHANDLQYDAMLDRHDDVEDLLSFGISFKEVIERSPYPNWNQMRRSFKRGDRQDLIEKVEALKKSEQAKGQAFMVHEKGLSFEIARRPSKTFKLDPSS